MMNAAELFFSQIISNLHQSSVFEPPQNSLYSLLLLAAALASGYIAVVAWKRVQIGPTASSISLFMAASAWWGLTYSIHWSGFFHSSGLFWLDATYLGVVVVPTAYLGLPE